MSEFEKVWLVTRLARRAATLLAGALLLLALAWTSTGLLLFVDTKIHSFLPGVPFGFLEQAMWLPLLCLSVAGGLGIIGLYSEPAAIDKSLQIRDDAREGDPIGEGTLTALQADTINRSLRRLRGYAEGWFERGQVDRRASLYWSPVLSQNACTYGGAGDTVRVVYSGDLLCTALIDWGEEEPPAWLGSAMTDQDLAAILGHELGHVHHRDFISAVFLGRLVRVLGWMYLPFVLLDRLAATLGRIIKMLPFGGILSFAFTLACRLPIFVVLALLRTGQIADSVQGQLREYVADAFAIKLMGEADSLVTAMMKLADLQLAVLRVKGDRTAARWDRYATAVALGKESRPDGTIAEVLRFLASVTASHPPTQGRLERMGRLGFMIEEEASAGGLKGRAA